MNGPLAALNRVVNLPWTLSMPATPTSPAPATAPASSPYPHVSVATHTVEPLAMDEEALLRAAVALDVLTTRTQHLRAEPTVLADLTALCCEVGELGGMDDEARAKLVAFATGPAGEARAVLAESMAATHAVPSTPASVAAVLRVLEAAAAHLVRDACLRLDAALPVDYRQA